MAKLIEVVGAVIVRDGKVLCAQRGAESSLAGLWEFPGGKVEPGETARDALVREITEELQCVVSVGSELETTSYDYDFGTVILTTFFCELVSGAPRFTEHADVRWLPPADLPALDWAPADLPAVARIVTEGVPVVS
ncbi:(deoxy)nucleoside triphosphate pyrophosphohydrolase [Demequina aurantiaca]|uniref:(deoxy)nucleoside triphosphate pyrophosphohydrolase n=1 Tax=Demequina aurantiaca TaxID=676200 RepID=UPI003D34E957